MTTQSEIKEFKVEASALQATLNYLSSRPYGEVVQLIGLLRQSKPIESEKEIRVVTDKD